MRFGDLKGLSDEAAREMISKCPKVKMKEVLDDPKVLLKKILVFRGNYDGFDTDRLCVRTFEYVSAECKWKVSDITVYDMFESSFEHHFSKQELESKFDVCNAEGFIIDA